MVEGSYQKMLLREIDSAWRRWRREAWGAVTTWIMRNKTHLI